MHTLASIPRARKRRKKREADAEHRRKNGTEFTFEFH